MTFIDRETKYLPMLALVGATAGLPPEYLPAIARVESAFLPEAKVSTGPDGARGGAYGLCQMTLRTARDLGFKGDAAALLYPDVNAEWAARLSVANLKRIAVADGQTYSDAHLILDLAAMHNSGKLYAKAPRVSVEYAQKVLHLAEMYRERCVEFYINRTVTSAALES